jgi:hypothetical protein
MKISWFASSVVAAMGLPAFADGQNAIPDLSGMWGRNVFNFESPDAGPGPIVNLRRIGPDAARPLMVGDPVPLVGDYTNPMLRPEAAAVLRQRGQTSASGHDFPDPSNQCATYSPPYLFTIQLGMQLLQSRNEVTIVYNQNEQVRHVRLNDVHPHDLKPTPMGDSVGQYEGDTLVVDTVGIEVRPTTMVDRFGTPQSDAMHVVERYRLIDARDAAEALARQEKTSGRVCGDEACGGAAAIDRNFAKGLRVELRIEDPKIFTTSWSANVTYMHVRRPWGEGICAENNTDVLDQGFEHTPTAARSDF